MMTQAFYTGVSGLKTYSSGIDVTADNLANVSTTGFRAYNAEYANLFESTLASASVGLSDTVGVGVRMNATSMSQEQGSLITTERNSDLAILGDGWFGVQKEGAETLYTRAGEFNFDSQSNLVTNDGYYVLGTYGGNISADNVLTQRLDDVPLGDVNAQEKLRFPNTLTYPPEPTTTAQFSGNIGTVDELRTMSAGVIDATGTRNELRLEFSLNETQTPPGTQWSVKATTSSLDGEEIYDVQTGEVAFDERGALISSTLTTIDNNGSPVTIDLGQEFSGVVSIANLDITASSVSDGSIGGELVGYGVNQNGEVVATFTNGQQSSVGQIAVYHFQNDQGLERLGSTRYARSSNSGEAFFVKDQEGNNIIGTTLANYNLESSNVDMTESLTELIVLQRAYDANSKSITTADQMMQKALNMDAR